MLSSLTVVTPAQSLSLVSLYEAKIALGLQSSTDEALDEQLEMFIEWSSAEIAALCNRTFARETVIERFDANPNYNNRIYLSRYPVRAITAIDEDGDALTLDTDYRVDMISGLVTRADNAWGAPVSFSYTGGYDLPNDSPKALRQAALLMTREAYYATTRGDASVRMIRHKDSSITYFDPNAKSGSSAGSDGSPARRAVGSLLSHFTRFWV